MRTHGSIIRRLTPSLFVTTVRRCEYVWFLVVRFVVVVFALVAVTVARLKGW